MTPVSAGIIVLRDYYPLKQTEIKVQNTLTGLCFVIKQLKIESQNFNKNNNKRGRWLKVLLARTVTKQTLKKTVFVSCFDKFPC